MRPVTAVNALRSLRGSALLVLVMASLVAPAATLARPASNDDLVNVIVSFNGPGGKQALKAAGGRVHWTFQLIDAVSAQMPRGRMAALERKEGVKSVELDHKLAVFHHDADTGNAELEAAWGVEHIGGGDVHNAGNTGRGIKVGVIDSGIDYNHPDLDTVYVGGWDFFNNDSDPFDDNGHGTHVAGTIAAELNEPPAGVVGVAPDVDLYAYKVVDANGEGDYSGLIAALDRAVTVDQVDVVNMSLGAHAVSQALQDAVAAAYDAGTVLVAASGNVNPLDFFELLFGCPVAYPAAYDQVLATTYTGPNDELTGFSCTGPQVDFAAPGDLIKSTVPTGSCMFCDPSGYREDMQGTSMASPHLAGTVALVLSHGISNEGDPATLADDVKAHLCATTQPGFGVLSTPIPQTDPRYPQYFGCGVVDAKQALITNPPPTSGEPNNPPVAVDDSASVSQNGSVSIDVLANDTDADEDTLSVSAVGTPSHGSASVEPGSEILYAPTTGYTGPDSFTYEVTDGVDTDTGTVTVSVGAVNHPPVANNDPASTSEAWPVVVDVLANDTDADSNALELSSVTQPAHGSAVMNGNSVKYTPSPGFSGTDAFTYDVSDGHGGTDTGTVTVTVSPTPRQMHVADLDATATLQTTKWTAKVTVRVRNSSGGAVNNVVVRGTWSTGENVSCTTGTAGNCTITKNRIGAGRLSVTFTVTNLTKSGWAYLASANFDPDAPADSNGTQITVAKP